MMSVRKSIASVAVAALAGSIVTLTASGASAAYVADASDSKATPVAADLIGVGSDTTQIAVHNVAAAWNSGGKTTNTYDIASFAATSEGTIALPGGEITRPNGSGAGKVLLYGTGNNADVDFARSSSSLSDAEVAAGLQQFPFALDELQMVTSGNVASHAPSTLTSAQIVGIYNGTYTNWSQVGGTSGTIKPYIPQSGSGTRSFFVAQLKAANGGVDVTLAETVTPTQEHDPADIRADANAVAPFSVGRADLSGGAVSLVSGWSAKRAVYNVVRASDLESSAIQSVFGEDGYFCSPAAATLIEAGGLKQLASTGANGVCGEATQTATSNFAVNQTYTTSTTLTATSPSAKTVKLTATVAPVSDGTVNFYEGTTLVKGSVPVVSGQFTTTLASIAAGAHTYTAAFAPASTSLALASTSTAVSVTVSDSDAAAPNPTDDGKAAAIKAKITKVKKQLKKAKKAHKTAKVKKLKKKLKKLKKQLKAAS